MEERLAGGNAGGAVLVDGTVRRATGTWTPAVHALLDHLARKGFPGVPRVLGTDDQGREVLTFVPGETVGDRKPWPAWVHSDEALVEVGAWLRAYHEAVRDFVPPADARWRIGSHVWRPGDVIGHNDAAPYNAVWSPDPDEAPRAPARGAPRGVWGVVPPHDEAPRAPARGAPRGAWGVVPPDHNPPRLVGFVDWDFASPCPPVWDLAFTAWAWVPLHARSVVEPEGFAEFDRRPERLRMLLGAYGWTGSVDEVLDAVQDRMAAHVEDVRALALTDPLFARLVEEGAIDGVERALAELRRDRPTF